METDWALASGLSDQARGETRASCGHAGAMGGSIVVGTPSGTVTFLLTDIEDSTRLWDAAPEAMRAALAMHDSIVQSIIHVHGGHVFATGGDGFAAAFARAGDAIEAARKARRALLATSWPGNLALRVRMGIHTGEA